MYLVHERKKKPGTWEVAWPWLPQFLGADPSLVKAVDVELTTLLKELNSTNMQTESFSSYLHLRAIDAIVRRYPIKGLAQYLEAVGQVDPEEVHE